MNLTYLICINWEKSFSRLFLIIFFIFCSVFSYAQQQQVNLKGNNLTLKSVFKQIEQQTKLFVDYNVQDVNDSHIVKGLPINGNIKDVIEQLLKGTNCIAVFSNGHIIISKIKETDTSSSQKRITGKIKDEQGEPLIGASVVAKGTTNGTITDINGEFSLAVDAGTSLEVKYVGYLDKEITVGRGQKPILVQLKEDTQTLDEVVVIGYGTAKKSDLAGSAVRADLTALQESPSISLGSALQGIIPGLNVGAVSEAGKSPDISIRGRTSISGGNTPLIVLDGIIYRGDMIDINMNDVESVDVLKDASAAAIYGSEASNGVILVTSKTGKTMSKPVIEYSGSYSFQSPTNKDMYPEGRDGFLRKIADRYLEESRSGDDMLQMNKDWDVTKHLMDNNTLQGYLNGTDTNWWNILTDDHPHIQNHNLSIRGKSELSSYFFSMGYTEQQNLIINDAYQRYNVRINLDTKITKWLKIGVQSFFSVGDYSGVSPSLSTVMKMPPIVAVYDEEGEMVKQPYKNYLNPLQSLDQDDVDKRYNLFANFYADIDFPFLKGLNYRLNFSQNLIANKQFNFNEWGENFTGNGSKENNSTYNYTVDNILTYKKTFNKHAVNATFVYGIEKRQNEMTKAEASNFTNPVLGFNNLGAGQADLQAVKSGAWEETSLYTMFRTSYTYNDRYIFTGTIRRDGFSGFGENHKYGVFPSGAMAWRISEEDFFKEKIAWMENLKLRFSYGQNGNRTVGRYQTLAKMGSQVGYLFGDDSNAEQMQWISSLANADLKWETTNTFNVAIDFSALNNRIFGTLEYYLSQTNNLLYNIDIPKINGIGTISTNIGKMNNRGFEMTITGIPIQTKGFEWDVTFNFSRNRNKIKSILGYDNDGDGREDDLIANKIFIGHPYGVCYDYKIIGMWQLADKKAGIIPDGFDYGSYKIYDLNDDKKIPCGDKFPSFCQS